MVHDATTRLDFSALRSEHSNLGQSTYSRETITREAAARSDLEANVGDSDSPAAVYFRT